jgi:hypothetical protein
MKRTNIYLPDDQWKRLNSLSRQQTVPVTELIRRAIAQVYPPRRHSDFERALDAVTGMWREHPDIRSTETYLRELRQDDRLERLAQ